MSARRISARLAQRLCLILGLLALPVLAQDRPAETIVAGLSQNRVAITADFDGSEILVYGAVRRDSPPPEGRLDVIVTVEGPPSSLLVRRKDRVWGIWVNHAAISVDSAPSFYAVATTGHLKDILTETENLRQGITIDRVVRAVGITAEADGAGDFVEAMLRVRRAAGTYQLLENRVQLTEQTLFRTDVVLPANLTEGIYKVRLFLLRGGAVVAQQERHIAVHKAGLERLIFTMAQEQPLIYGLLCLLMAGVSGWAASAGFRLLQR
ncbi:TIGR02186 family protein [Xinfangfangia sp. CPCC 101601]|uniref:TIGR02186 family protein n=1 Tax=Pseudogemmobacter lacusdianii TaxID=3069608 RepID=A0ABU0VW07_9RHOB|nr:TIGR02186 family protein [Xinfangfangia sp. CPCC 101601]MDQ2065922.1 TIGR02186 family protein [Xinfangfangia sp. CPCC 101601]